MSEPSAPRSAVTGPPGATAQPGPTPVATGPAPVAPGPAPAAAPAYRQVAPPRGEVQLAPGSVVKFRNPVMVAVLTLVTLGIYTIAWWYLVNREMADHGRALGRPELGDDPARSTLAVFPGALVVVPAVWTTVTTFQRIQAAQRLHRQVPINGWLGLVLAIVLSPALMGYMQSGLNSAWSAAADGH
jgi:Domain of unknown function (DUF4234)